MGEREPATRTALTRWCPALSATLLVAWVALAALAHENPSFAWDRALAERLLSVTAPSFDALMRASSVPGELLGVYITFLGGAALATWRWGWRAGALSLAMLALMGVNEILKDIVDRPRPLEPMDGGGESFPSGHTMHAVLTVGLVWLLAAPQASRTVWRRSLVAATVLIPLVVGLSRVYLERHWPSDVLGSYLLGTAMLLAMAWVWERAQPHPAVNIGVSTPRDAPEEAGAP